MTGLVAIEGSKETVRHLFSAKGQLSLNYIRKNEEVKDAFVSLFIIKVT